GDRVAHALDEVEVALARVGTSHRLEDAGRPGLEGQVHVLADGVTVGDRRDQRLAEVLRVRAREADALDSVDRVAGTEQLAELGPDLWGEIAAPRVHVLAEERHLLHAFAGEARHLGDDLAGPAALLAAADSGDDAVGADRVAPHRDLHPGLEAP